MFDQCAYTVAEVISVDWDGQHQLVLDVALSSAAGAVVDGLGFALYHVGDSELVGITTLGDDVDPAAVNWADGMLAIIPSFRGPLSDVREWFIHAMGGPSTDWDALDAEFSNRILHHRATAGETTNIATGG